MERVEERGRAKPVSRPVVLEEEVVRFDLHQIIQHIILFTSFILLAATGLPLKFNEWATSQWWVSLWGGIETTRAIHHYAAWAMVSVCVYHGLYLGYGIFIKKKPFPVKMIPSPQDFVNMFHELQYYVGLRKEKPQFDRFNWREKFDYWAIFWGMPIIGLSGFILMYPVFASKFLPGWAIPAALIAHGDEAILAVSWIVIIHLFFNHMAPGVFPLNKSIFTGRVPKERYKKEHPLEYERLQAEEGLKVEE